MLNQHERLLQDFWAVDLHERSELDSVRVFTLELINWLTNPDSTKKRRARHDNCTYIAPPTGPKRKISNSECFWATLSRQIHRPTACVHRRMGLTTQGWTRLDVGHAPDRSPPSSNWATEYFKFSCVQPPIPRPISG